MESENITPQEGSREGYEGNKKNESREASSNEDTSKTYRPRTAKKFIPSSTAPNKENKPAREVTHDEPKSKDERSTPKERPFWTDFSGKEEKPARENRSSEEVHMVIENLSNAKNVQVKEPKDQQEKVVISSAKSVQAREVIDHLTAIAVPAKEVIDHLPR